MAQNRESPELATPGTKEILRNSNGPGHSEIAVLPQPAPAPALRRIDQIIAGQRFRHDLGDINSLAKSIAEIGLLQPVVITPDDRLIAGYRRMHAAELLGWTEIPIRIVDLDKIVRGEYAENSIRKDFTLSEAVAIKRALEPIERKAAQKRMRAGKPSGEFPKGRAADKVAKVVGKDRTTIAKAEAVVAAAEAEPEKYGRLKEAMDKSGRVNGPYRRLKNAQQAEQIRAEPPPLPGNGPYRGGLVDIPWAYEPDYEDAPQRGVLPYPTLSIEQACALNVASMLHEDCIVGMWVINYVLVHGLYLPVLQRWGLEPKTIITWPKEHVGQGRWAKGQTEHLVIAARGKPVVTLRDHTTLLKGPFHLVQKAAHSTKPVEAYTYFASLCPAPRYFDLFSRYRHNDKWDCHGDEAPADDLSIPEFLRRAETGS